MTQSSQVDKQFNNYDVCIKAEACGYLFLNKMSLNFMFYWPCILVQLWWNDQINAHLRYIKHFYYYNPLFLYVSSYTVLIIRRSNCINTASGIVLSLSDSPVCVFLRLEGTRTPDCHLEYYTRCFINTFRLPDDEHNVARNMWKKRIIIIKNVLYNVIVQNYFGCPHAVIGIKVYTCIFLV